MHIQWLGTVMHTWRQTYTLSGYWGQPHTLSSWEQLHTLSDGRQSHTLGGWGKSHTLGWG